MSTINYLTVRNTVLPVVNAVTANYSTLTGSTIRTNVIATSTITVRSLNIASTMISLGQSTNQTYNNFSNGSFAPVSWVDAKSAMSSANKTVQSANGLYQMIIGNTTSGLFLSSDSGITWTTLTGGLPTLTGSAYWSDGAISANGQYITLSVYGGSLWMSADYGRTFALTNQPTPDIWLPLNGNTTDSMGSSTVTPFGSPGYVTVNRPGYTTQVINLLNTAGGSATRYIRGTWTASDNFMISLWFNTQSTGIQQMIFDSGNEIAIFINGSQQLCYQFVSNGIPIAPVVTVANTIVINTWYYVVVIFQKNGTCSMYLNNTLVGSSTNSGGYAPYPSVNQFSLGTYDTDTSLAFNGYLSDVEITNSVSAYVPIPLLQPNIWLPFENTAGDLGSHSLPPGATPFIHLPFEGNVTDSMGASTVTATGAVTYVPVNREGYTGQAIRLTNTAGGTATQFVRSTWTGAANFTVSFWFNAQTINASNSQVLFSSYNTAFIIYIAPTTNRLECYMIVAGATSVVIGTSAPISSNTWYYVTVIYQTNGLCSLYLNNTLVGTNTNIGGLAQPASDILLGIFSNAANLAFNGTIDDFRIYNSAIPYVPVSNTTVTGSLSYVPGIVGLNAVNLVNTASGTPVNYIKGAWDYLNNFTVSGWVNFQSITSSFQVIYSSHVRRIEFFLNPSGQLVAQMPTGTGLTYTGIATTYAVSINTWYHLVMIFQINGLCSFYVNSSLIGTFTNSGGYGTIVSSGLFSLGTYDDNTNTLAFNGYIDDFRIYNAAIPFHVLAPQNYRSLALSGTGQYALAATAAGWVVGSSDTSRTWEKEAVTVGTQSNIIQPNMTGLAQTQWEQGGVSWVANASTTLAGGYDAHRVFNNDYSSRWVPNSFSYSTAGNTSGITTTIQSIGTVTGDWLQLQSSVPLVMTSYQFVNGFVPTTVSRLPRTFHIIGSNDGTTWQPIQSGTGATSPSTSSYTLINTIIVNSTSTQTFGSSTLSTTAYPTSTNAYIYFRLVCLSSYMSTAEYLDIGEWIVNFVRPLTISRPPASLLSMNHSGQYQLVATGPAAGSIMPNQTGLAAATWSQGGVNWGVSASSTSSGLPVYNIFDNSIATYWAGLNPVFSSSGNTSSFSNTFYSNGTSILTIPGEWVQIVSSVPVVLSSYQIGISNPNNTAKTYYIVGSNDGTTWYALQFATVVAQPGVTNFILYPETIIVNSNSTQKWGPTTLITTTYTGTTNSYTYFRFIITSVFFAMNTTPQFSELYLNFRNSVSYSNNYGSTWLNTSPTVSNESVALSPSGQYALSTNSVAPFARLSLNNTNVDAQGVLVPTTGAGTVTYSESIKTVGSHSAFFNNTAGTVPTVFLNYTVPAILNRPSALTMACWMYPTAYGLTVYPFGFYDNAGTVIFTLYSRSAETGIQFTTSTGISYISTATPIPLNTWSHITVVFLAGITTLYMNGVLVITNPTGASPGTILAGTGSITNFVVGSRPTGDAFRGHFDDVRIYTSALSADEINGLFRNPALTQTIAVSSSYLPITSYTEPTLPGITANIVDKAVSQTGQYMVAVTSSTTNNVYYSTDYGATFTALTIGTTAMVSCSISYDGSYLMVSNATTTLTLNRNTRGFTLAVGNQAGQINQGLNAIAIGDKAGRTNQSANSIVLNASGSALDAAAPGFYVAPIANAGSSSAAPFNLLGYGTDNQIVQSSALTVLSNGNVGIGTSNPQYPVHIQYPGTPGVGGILTSFGTAHSLNRIAIVDENGSFPPYITGNAGNGLGLSTPGTAIKFYTNGSLTNIGTERMVISGGNVSINNQLFAANTVNSLGSTQGNTVPLMQIGSGGSGSGAYGRLVFYGNRWTNGPDWQSTSIMLRYEVDVTNFQFIGFNSIGLGIGISNPGYHLQLATDSAAKPSTNTWTVASDERLKEDITLADIDRCVEIIRAVPLKHYRWKNDVYTMEQVKDRSKLGWIAQDVEKVFPKAVGTHIFRYNQLYEDVVKEDGSTEKQMVSEDVLDDCRDLNADQLYAVMYGAIQKLIVENDSQKATNTALTQKLDALSASHAALLTWAQTQGFSGAF